MNNKAIIVSISLVWACTPDLSDGEGTRCSDALACADGLSCYRGFCVSDEYVAREPDGAVIAVDQADVGPLASGGSSAGVVSGAVEGRDAGTLLPRDAAVAAATTLPTSGTSPSSAPVTSTGSAGLDAGSNAPATPTTGAPTDAGAAVTPTKPANPPANPAPANPAGSGDSGSGSAGSGNGMGGSGNGPSGAGGAAGGGAGQAADAGAASGGANGGTAADAGAASPIDAGRPVVPASDAGQPASDAGPAPTITNVLLPGKCGVKDCCEESLAASRGEKDKGKDCGCKDPGLIRNVACSVLGPLGLPL